MDAANFISLLFIPSIVTSVLIFGIIKKSDIYDLFIEGAKDGFKTALAIMPYIVAVFIAIDIFKASGALELLQNGLEPLFNLIGFPKELFPLALMKPVSGSGSLAIAQKIIEQYGPDSFIGKTACLMVGSSETIFYTLAVYFGATSVKYGRHTLKVALISYIISIFAAVLVCRLM